MRGLDFVLTVIVHTAICLAAGTALGAVGTSHAPAAVVLSLILVITGLALIFVLVRDVCRSVTIDTKNGR